MQTFPVGPQTLADGVTQIPEQPLPLGTSGLTLSLDVTNMIAGQTINYLIEHWNGTDWLGCGATMTGPWLNKQGIVQNVSAITCSFGTINGVPVVSAAGWKIRATLTVVNGPVTTAGGTLVVM